MRSGWPPFDGSHASTWSENLSPCHPIVEDSHGIFTGCADDRSIGCIAPRLPWYMKTLPILGLLVTVGLAWCQIAYQPDDLSTLFARVSGSDFVVMARLDKIEVIRPRLSSEEADRFRREQEAASKAPVGTVVTVRVPHDMSKAGVLFRLQTTRTLCRQSDFRPDSRELGELSGPVYVLVPYREAGSDSIGEEFAPGRSYLVFLEKDPRQGQFGSLYEIDTTRTYYRAHLRSRGVIQLAAPGGRSSDRATALLSAVTALCDAVKPADAATKIANLTALMNATTTDPGLRQSADAAIKALRAAQATP